MSDTATVFDIGRRNDAIFVGVTMAVQAICIVFAAPHWTVWIFAFQLAANVFGIVMTTVGAYQKRRTRIGFSMGRFQEMLRLLHGETYASIYGVSKAELWARGMAVDSWDRCCFCSDEVLVALGLPVASRYVEIPVDEHGPLPNVVQKDLPTWPQSTTAIPDPRDAFMAYPDPEGGALVDLVVVVREGGFTLKSPFHEVDVDERDLKYEALAEVVRDGLVLR